MMFSASASSTRVRMFSYCGRHASSSFSAVTLGSAFPSPGPAATEEYFENLSGRELNTGEGSAEMIAEGWETSIAVLPEHRRPAFGRYVRCHEAASGTQCCTGAENCRTHIFGASGYYERVPMRALVVEFLPEFQERADKLRVYSVERRCAGFNEAAVKPYGHCPQASGELSCLRQQQRELGAFYGQGKVGKDDVGGNGAAGAGRRFCRES